jgi:hypothetical protein
MQCRTSKIGGQIAFKLMMCCVDYSAGRGPGTSKVARRAVMRSRSVPLWFDCVGEGTSRVARRAGTPLRSVTLRSVTENVAFVGDVTSSVARRAGVRPRSRSGKPVCVCGGVSSVACRAAILSGLLENPCCPSTGLVLGLPSISGKVRLLAEGLAALELSSRRTTSLRRLYCLLSSFNSGLRAASPGISGNSRALLLLYCFASYLLWAADPSLSPAFCSISATRRRPAGSIDLRGWVLSVTNVSWDLRSCIGAPCSSRLI